MTAGPDRAGSADVGESPLVAELARVLGHELAEIAALLDGYTEELLDASGPCDLDAIDHLQATTARLRDVYEDLIELAEVASAPPVPAVVDPAEALAAAQRRVAADVDIDIPALPPVLADPGQLEQLFVHVLRSTRDPSDLMVRGFVEGPQVRLDIGAETAPSARPVHRLAGSLVGRGIVLAVSSHIAARNGGRLWLDGESGSGRTICLVLPAASP